MKATCRSPLTVPSAGRTSAWSTYRGRSARGWARGGMVGHDGSVAAGSDAGGVGGRGGGGRRGGRGGPVAVAARRVAVAAAGAGGEDQEDAHHQAGGAPAHRSHSGRARRAHWGHGLPDADVCVEGVRRAGGRARRALRAAGRRLRQRVPGVAARRRAGRDHRRVAAAPGGRVPPAGGDGHLRGVRRDLGRGGRGVGAGRRRPTRLWEGLEAFPAYGDEVEPATLAAACTESLGRPPDAAGLADHQGIGDAWEQSGGQVSIVAALLEQLTPARPERSASESSLAGLRRSAAAATAPAAAGAGGTGRHRSGSSPASARRPLMSTTRASLVAVAADRWRPGPRRRPLRGLPTRSCSSPSCQNESGSA